MDQHGVKIVIDEAIPFIKGVLEPYAEVVYCKGTEINSAVIKDADAIIIRNRTKCDASLLDGSGVKLIASATIGMDHVDLGYCKEHGIFVQNATGSNAGGMMNYVFSALYGVASRKAIRLTDATIGIIGVGHVGSRIEAAGQKLGFKILRYDPPREAAEGPGQFCSLDKLLSESNVVTMHVPLNDTTRNMANAEFFSKMKQGAIFINAARGEIVDESALKEAIPKLGAVVIDTWQHEPDIDRELMDMVDIATPHIAGYSYQGKQNGTMAVVRSAARFFDFKPLFDFFPEAPIANLASVSLSVAGKTQGQIASLFQYNYPIFTDDFILRMDPGSFESIRSSYQYRKEFIID